MAMVCSRSNTAPSLFPSRNSFAVCQLSSAKAIMSEYFQCWVRIGLSCSQLWVNCSLTSGRFFFTLVRMTFLRISFCYWLLSSLFSSSSANISLSILLQQTHKLNFTPEIQLQVGNVLYKMEIALPASIIINMNYELIEQRYTYREQDPEYKGEALERQLASGPSEQRRCRDCFCCLLYLAFWIALIAVSFYAFSKGNPQLLAAPFDATGLQCGFGQYADYPYAYYSAKNFSEFGCIKECPTSGKDVFQTYLGGKLYPNTQFPAYQTVQIVSLCYPISQEINKYILSGLTFYDQFVSDMKSSWKISLISLFAALLLSIVLLVFIRACGKCIVISILVLYLGILIGLGFVCMKASKEGIAIEGYEEWTNPQALQTVAYVSWILAGLSFIALCCSYKKIKIAGAVLKAAAEFTRQQCKVVIVPILLFFAMAIFFVFWIYSSIYIFSCGEVRQCGKSPYACIDWEVGVKRSLGLFFFGLFWNCEVAISICQFVIASTAAYWYFSHLGNATFPLAKSFCRALTLQLGSIVFGSLILCIVWMLQIMLEVLHHFTKNQTISNSPVNNVCADYFVRCSRCCLACFQRFVRFITKNAFLMMAISGQGFCSSAHQAFYLAMRTSAEYAIAHGVGHTMMFFGKLLVSVAVTFFAYLLATGLQEFSENLYSPFSPVVMSFVISYVVGSLFMDVFAVASDTFLLCYALEMDILKGVSYACPPSMKALFDSHGK